MLVLVAIYVMENMCNSVDMKEGSRMCCWRSAHSNMDIYDNRALYRKKESLV